MIKEIIIDGQHTEQYVDELGNVYTKHMELRKQRKINSGYWVVDIKIPGGKKYTLLVHRLVAIAFIPNPDNLPTVNHKHGNKDDNRASELEWCTYSRNNIHAVKTGLRTPLSCEDHQYATLTNEQVHEICTLLENGYTYDQIIDEMNISNITNIKSKIKMIKTRNAWTKISRYYNLPESKCKNGIQKFTDEQIHQICKMIQDGNYTREMILMELGIELTDNNKAIFNNIYYRRKHKRISKYYTW